MVQKEKNVYIKFRYTFFLYYNFLKAGVIRLLYWDSNVFLQSIHLSLVNIHIDKFTYSFFFQKIPVALPCTHIRKRRQPHGALKTAGKNEDP